jgi:iron complex outermembrane receptor protein
VAGGNVEQASVGGRYGEAGDRVAWRAWGKGFTRGPQYHPDDRNFDDWRRTQAGFRIDWRPGQADNFTLLGGAYGMMAGSRLAVSTFSPPALNIVERNADFSGQHLTGAWRRNLAQGSDIQLRAYWDRTDRRDLNYREVRNTVDLDFLHHLSQGRHELTWGAGFHVSPSHFIQTVPTVNFFPERDTYSIYSGFVQDSIWLVPDRLAAVLGTKLERNSYSGFEIQPGGRLIWTPTPRQALWAAVTRAVRTPSRIEEGFEFSYLAAPAVPLYLRLIGDGQFEPEELAGYELGYRAFVRKNGYIDFAVFYNRYNDLLSVENRPPVAEATPPPPHLVLPLYFRNGIAAQTRGGEISSLWDLTPWWRVQGSYSYLRLTAGRYPGSNDASTQNQLEGDSPRHKVVAQSLFNLPREFFLDLTYRYVGAVPDMNAPSYSTGDVRIARRIARGLELSAVGQNLFQPHHREYGGLPGAPVEVRRSAYVKLTWTR